MSAKLRMIIAMCLAVGLSFGVVACEQKAEENKEESAESEGEGEGAEGEAAEGEEGEAEAGEGDEAAAEEGEGEAAEDEGEGAAEGDAMADGGDQWLKITADHNDDKGPVEATMAMELQTATVDLENLENAMAEFTVDLATFKSDNDQRDGHVKSAEFFDVGQYPKATVKVHGVQPEENGKHKATATVDLHGQSKDVPVEFAIVETKDDGSVIIEGSGKLNRAEFGVGGAPAEANVKEEIDVALRMHLANKG